MRLDQALHHHLNCFILLSLFFWMALKRTDNPNNIIRKTGIYEGYIGDLCQWNCMPARVVPVTLRHFWCQHTNKSRTTIKQRPMAQRNWIQMRGTWASRVFFRKIKMKLGMVARTHRRQLACQQSIPGPFNLPVRSEFHSFFSIRLIEMPPPALHFW